MHMLRRLLVGVGVVMPLVIAAPSATAAPTGVPVTLNASMFFSPGLTAVPSAQGWSFSGTMSTTVGVANGAITVAANSSCAGSASSIGGESVTHGAGSGTWSCSSGVFAGKHGTFIYVRGGANMTMSLDGDLRGQLNCQVTPDQTPPSPVTSARLICGGNLEAV